ncbi:MAG TPA: hypothetical protein VFX86_00250 [Candidatus Saccharimonadales bacterium]|nr:hypothetical protein [Candidatus Saccharimonadales bacterium]
MTKEYLGASPTISMAKQLGDEIYGYSSIDIPSGFLGLSLDALDFDTHSARNLRLHVTPNPLPRGTPSPHVAGICVKSVEGRDNASRIGEVLNQIPELKDVEPESMVDKTFVALDLHEITLSALENLIIKLEIEKGINNMAALKDALTHEDLAALISGNASGFLFHELAHASLPPETMDEYPRTVKEYVENPVEAVVRETVDAADSAGRIADELVKVELDPTRPIDEMKGLGGIFSRYRMYYGEI